MDITVLPTDMGGFAVEAEFLLIDGSMPIGCFVCMPVDVSASS